MAEKQDTRTYGFMSGLPPREPDWAGLFEAIGQPWPAYFCRTGNFAAALAYLLMKKSEAADNKEQVDE